jgi:hypothetical protein
MEGGALAKHIFAHQRQGKCTQSKARRLIQHLMTQWQGYLLQSLKSLSAIENTASALISISRTKHCLKFR